jgi:gamma-glutamylcyclotransferase (GGCT)/AIG2-like uncharacterized protein YtfP
VKGHSTSTERVFVYGTLRSPRPDVPDDRTRFHPQIAPYILSATPARLRRVRLYDLGAYPGLRPDGTACVRGELFVVRAAGLTVMDHIEGHPHFFRRRRAWVRTEVGERVHAWVYWAPEPLVEGRQTIRCGDWLVYRQPAAEGGSET